jgi:hypothetical protein
MNLRFGCINSASCDTLSACAYENDPEKTDKIMCQHQYECTLTTPELTEVSLEVYRTIAAIARVKRGIRGSSH